MPTAVWALRVGQDPPRHGGRHATSKGGYGLWIVVSWYVLAEQSDRAGDNVTLYQRWRLSRRLYSLSHWSPAPPSLAPFMTLLASARCGHFAQAPPHTAVYRPQHSPPTLPFSPLILYWRGGFARTHLASSASWPQPHPSPTPASLRGDMQGESVAPNIDSGASVSATGSPQAAALTGAPVRRRVSDPLGTEWRAEKQPPWRSAGSH